MKTLSTVLLFTALTAKLAASQDAPPPPGQEGGDGQEGQPGPDGAPPPPPAPAPDVDPNRPNENYPYWVTNDYNCVIECLKPFEAPDIPNPAPELESAAYGCCADKCNKEWMGNNMYQMSYIIQMRYATGSIYEDEKMGEWGQGAPPDKNAGGDAGAGVAEKDKDVGKGDGPHTSDTPSSSVNSVPPTTMSTSKGVATITTNKPAPTGSDHKNGTAAEEHKDSGAVRQLLASTAWVAVVPVLISLAWL